MKKYFAAVVVSCAAFGLAGCEPGHNVPGATLVGATAGGLVGNAIGGGSVAGIIGGALVGGVVGNFVGRAMDRQDRINMQNAIVTTPVDQESSWTNERTHTTYVVRPVRDYHSEGRYCREYQTRIRIDGEWKNAYGKACRTSGGQWHIVR